MPEERLLTVADVARRLDRSTEQIRRYLREGQLQGEVVGRQWFIQRDVLEAFQNRARERRGFLQRLEPAAALRALDDVIAMGDGPGSNLGEGKAAYRSASWWRR
jgi:excisionase family DNA binding protein